MRQLNFLSGLQNPSLRDNPDLGLTVPTMPKIQAVTALLTSYKPSGPD